LNQTNFHIINAAAGSGKTYNLVLQYLKLLLGSKTTKPYRILLALTFTNKAVNELKNRILATLLALSKDTIKDKNIKNTLCDRLAIDEKELSRRAQHMLRQILFEYGSFDVITLDKFTHRLIRIFVKELKLPFGFEVVLDPKSLLEETVSSIIEEVGKDELLTQLLNDFSISRVSQQNSWNIQKDLNEFAGILLNENDRIPLYDLKKKTILDHLEDFKTLSKEKLKAENKATEIATEALSLINQHGLEKSDFYKGTLYNHFQAVVQRHYSKLYSNQLALALVGEKSLYKQSLDTKKKEIIDTIQVKLNEDYCEIKKYVGKSLLSEATIKSWVPRSLLQRLEARLEVLQNRKEVRLLGEFNQKISKLVQDADAPFIYERLGERYQHYFLDEFQDTSKLQWTNLIPLISNALAGESLNGEQGSLLLVGDPKQAIYRWRGGDIKQFVNLFTHKDSPFQIKASNDFLVKNYRSGASIVNFNNQFFLTFSKLFEETDYHKIYGEGSQQEAQKAGGYVSVEAIPSGKKVDENIPVYVEKTNATVIKAIDSGYALQDIVVLVRTKKQASAIGAGLTEVGYPIISSESLVVGQSTYVQFILAILKLIARPNDSEQHKLIIDVLCLLKPDLEEENHLFILNHIHLKSKDFFKKLESQFRFKLSLNNLSKLSVLEAAESILESISLLPYGDPFLNTFIEDIFEFSTTESQTISGYLKFWEKQENTLRIKTPEGTNSISVMTIHQAKGLEFPVVILPFMDTVLNSSNIKNKIWYPFKEEPLSSIKWAWINASKNIQLYGVQGQSLYDQYVLEQKLDAFNVLYVALTRAKDQLYIITQEVAKEGASTYAELLKSFINNQGGTLDENTSFEWGEKTLKETAETEKETSKEEKIKIQFKTSSLWKKKLVVFNRPTKESILAQKKGLLLHHVLAKVTHSEKLSKVIEETISELNSSGETISFIEKKTFEIVHHPILSPYFKSDDVVLVEKDILVPDGRTLRPDRVNLLADGSAVILDYKTGEPKEEDTLQIDSYGSIYETLGYNPIKKFLVYIGSEIRVKNCS